MSSEVQIRPVQAVDLRAFFAHQLDPEANWMAAFTAPDPTDSTAFAQHWARVLGNTENLVRAVVAQDTVVGNVSVFPHDGMLEVSYWIGPPYWGRGYATAALSELLREVTVRPLRARAVKDNLGSLRVLAKCGFVVCGEDSGYAAARGAEVGEYVLELHA